MSTTTRRNTALALLATCIPVASSVPALPTATEVQDALRRAIDAVAPTVRSPGAGDAGLAVLLGRMRSMDVTHVSGCIVEETPGVTCIVRIDWGLDNQRYVPVSMQYRNTQWEAPTLATQRVPAPTRAQAQAAARRFAKEMWAEDTSNGELALMGSGLEIMAIDEDCRVDRDDGSVVCHTKFRVPVGEDMPEKREFDKSAHFHLVGSEWRFGRSPSSE